MLNDSTGRIVPPQNIYRNIASSASSTSIKEGTRVLFKQGSYSAGNTQVTGGERWHEGIVTDVNRRVSGTTTFSGHHAKGPVDGKGVNYRSYSYTFSNLRLTDLRLSSQLNVPLSNNNMSRTVDVDDYLNNGAATNITIDNNQGISRTFKPNDCVLAMWEHAKWQYFPATVVSEIPNGGKYEIDWDDGDTDGEF